MKSVVRSLPLIALLASSLLCFAADKKAPGNVVDSGSFGIFVQGRRVGTEKFEIAQMTDGNVTRAELKVEDGANKALQRSELQLTSTGELRHYSWNEVTPEKAQMTIDPEAQFLTAHISSTGQSKPVDQPFALPPTTAIMDDYFFSHRELLAWRYLGAGCVPKESGQSECKLTKSEFGVLIPRQRAAVLVTLEYVGKEKVAIRGQQVQLDRFNLQGDGIDWAMWLDEAHKLQRVVIAGDATEVVRD